MKNPVYYLIVFAFASVFASCDNQNTNKQTQDKAVVEKRYAVLVFENTDHDFGTITEGEKVTYAFRFTNQGDVDLKFSSVGTSCGCTASEYSTDPIKPGETGKIQVTFNSAHRLGMQNKKVTIRANTNPEFMVLNVYAQVIDKETEN